jgi:uncharacterized protein (TIGR03435 family)
LGEDNGGLVAEHISMAEFAEQISAKLQRPVIDRTGLRGQYDFRIDVTNYMVPAEGGENGRDRLDPLRVLLVGLQKQLGLKLESGRDTIRTIVVDGANRKPSGN